MSLNETFRIQDRDTIQETLPALAADSTVFSTRIQSELSFMGGHELYVYMQGDETVFLLRDEHRSDIDVLADEENYMNQPPLYLTKGSCWTSPAYLLLLLCHAYREVMRKTGREAGKVHGVFVTNTIIVNREEMEEIWEWLGVTVVDGADMHGEITTAFNGLDKERESLEHFFAYSNLATWTLDPEYDHVMENFPPYVCQNVASEYDCTPEETEDYDDEEDSLPDDSHDDEEETLRQRIIDGKPRIPLPESVREAFTFTPFEEPCPENTEKEEIGGRDDDDWEMDNRNMKENGERQVLEDGMAEEEAKGSSMKEEPQTADFMSAVPLEGVEILLPIDEPLRQFGRLAGMIDTYMSFVHLSMYAKLNRSHKENGKKKIKFPMHRIFYGNPGTGKTIAGHLYASILYEAGTLSKGHVVLVNGKAFAGILAENEMNVDILLKMARGGVLMVEEAYMLSTPCKDDPGKNVLSLLMRAMAKEKGGDFAVILTGRKDQIKQLQELNPRLATWFHELFRDFSPKELCQIARKKTEEDGYTLTSEAWTKLEGVIAEEHANRDPRTFGNARFVINLLEETYKRHGEWCRDNHVTKPAALRLIYASDIQ